MFNQLFKKMLKHSQKTQQCIQGYGIFQEQEQLLQNSQAFRQQMRGLITHVKNLDYMNKRKVTLIPGDGTGPEITDVCVDVLEHINAPINWERFDNSKWGSFKKQNKVPQEVIDSIRNNGVCLKGTLYTPIEKDSVDAQSMNVQLRKELGLGVNLTHVFSIPGLETLYSNVDIIVVRENVEGEYSGMEHEVVRDVVESLKIVTEVNSKKVAEFAFEFAKLNNRHKVTAIHKANIMKLGDGMFLKATRQIADNYPDIKYDEYIIDNTCMQLVRDPTQFDVMVSPNLYGNLVSNLGAGLCGGHGIMPGVNIGKDQAVFEQGARYVGREIAGKGVANPTAMLFSTAMMLNHLGLTTQGQKLENGLLKLYAQRNKNIITPDVGGSASTAEFVKVLKSLI